jgi:hypothetical protein
MKNQLLIILLVLFSSLAYGKELLPDYMLESSEKDESLQENEAVFKFIFNGIWDDNKARTIEFSMNGKIYSKKMVNNTYVEIKARPGKHIFQFFYDSYHYEIFTDSLLIKTQYRDVYSIQFQNSEYPVEVEKPVIYIYPEVPTEVEVKMNIKGENAFMYPEYIDSWKFTAHPNGDLVFGDKSYNYLFWESTQYQRNISTETQVGFVVEGKNVVAFFEEKLTEAGLSSTEQADFITYWGSRLQVNALNFVRFEFNESCNQYAELAITPKPDNVYRIYMSWESIDSFINCKPQAIVPMNRKGFTVVEWGGQELTNHSL